jgi:hypothetical protein
MAGEGLVYRVEYTPFVNRPRMILSTCLSFVYYAVPAMLRTNLDSSLKYSSRLSLCKGLDIQLSENTASTLVVPE